MIPSAPDNSRADYRQEESTDIDDQQELYITHRQEKARNNRR